MQASRDFGECDAAHDVQHEDRALRRRQGHDRHVDGCAQRRTTFRHVHVEKKPILLFGYQLAGEPFSMASVAWGAGANDLHHVVCPEPRNRTLSVEAFDTLASELLPVIDQATSSKGAPQFVVPNPATLDLLGRWGRRFAFSETKGDWAVPADVIRLARLFFFLGRYARMPGQQLVLPLTDALSFHWVTGQSTLENQQLAALTAWIRPGDVDAHDAALAAEHIEPGPVTDPNEDEKLATLVEVFNSARRDTPSSAQKKAMAAAEKAIVAHWSIHLQPAWAVGWRAVSLLRSLEEAPAAAERWDDDVGSWSRELLRQKEGKRSRARATTRQLIWERQMLEDRQANLESAWVYDDPMLAAEQVLEGRGLRGKVIKVDPDAVEVSANGRSKHRPIVVVRCAGSLLPAQTRLCWASNPKVVVEVESTKRRKDSVDVVLKVVAGMRKEKLPEVDDVTFFLRPPPAFIKRPQLPEAIPWSHTPDPTTTTVAPLVPIDEQM